MSYSRYFPVVVASLFLAGCSALPSDGPLASKIAADAQQSETEGYELFELDASVMKALHSQSSQGLARTFGNRAPAPIQRVGVGDVVVVTIWEAASGGLFSGSGTSNSARAETLPPQLVDRDRMISLPYGGRVQAAGLTPSQISAKIVASLEGKAINPQAMVTVQQAASSTAIVSGDVTGAGRVPLNVKGDRLMEVISQAGGVRAAPHETFIRLSRGSRTSEVTLAEVMANPSENIYIHPGDTIHVFRRPQSFTALGAVTKVGENPIDRSPFTLAQALGFSGGLADNQADATGVFLFRYESPAVVAALRPESPLLKAPGPVPVIYRMRFDGPQAYFLAKSFQVRAEDVLYVSNAASVEFVKAITVLRAIAQTARSIKAADPNN